MSEKKSCKRLLTWVLVIVMMLIVAPLNVLADETDTWPPRAMLPSWTRPPRYSRPPRQ